MEKRRIALLFNGDIYRVRGEFTAIHNRIKELKRTTDFIIDAYVYGEYFDRFTTAIKKIEQVEMKQSFELEGITYNCMWFQRSHLDNITHKFFKRRTAVEIDRIIKTDERFKEYDLIYANSLFTAHVGHRLKKKYGIPFVCTWHGSSIHTLPFKDKNVFKRTKRILENADMNFFVSDELYEIAKKIADNFKGAVSFNGIDTTQFRPRTKEEKQTIRKELGLPAESKCVAFVGNCMAIKNVQYLPQLFTRISKEVQNTKFVIIGTGAFDKLFTECNLDIIYANNVSNVDMPKWYGTMDLIVMPSINEGLPMTCLEATASGTPFVGSRVGAIADVVGVENTVEHNPEFNEAFAALCIKRLNETDHKVELPEKFMLANIVDKETRIITRLTGK